MKEHPGGLVSDGGDALSCVAWQAASKHMPAGERRPWGMNEEEEEEADEVEGCEGVDCVVFCHRLAARHEEGETAADDALRTALISSAYLIGERERVRERERKRERERERERNWQQRRKTAIPIDRSKKPQSGLTKKKWPLHSFRRRKQKKRKKAHSMASASSSPADEEAAAAAAASSTPAAAPRSRSPLAALRGFRDRFVDECRVEVREGIEREEVTFCV